MMELDFRFLNKSDGTKVLQARTGNYQPAPSKTWWKIWEADVEYRWSEWHTIREEVEEQGENYGN